MSVCHSYTGTYLLIEKKPVTFQDLPSPHFLDSFPAPSITSRKSPLHDYLVIAYGTRDVMMVVSRTNMVSQSVDNVVYQIRR